MEPSASTAKLCEACDADGDLLLHILKDADALISTLVTPPAPHAGRAPIPQEIKKRFAMIPGISGLVEKLRVKVHSTIN